MADIRELLKEFIQGGISSENLSALNELLAENTNEAEFTNILKEIAQTTAADPNYKESDWDEIIRSILEHRPAIRRIPFYKKTWIRAAAAVLILGLSFGTYFVIQNKESKPSTVNPARAGSTDIAPGGNKAILILGNGSKIMLDSAANGTLALQGNTKVVKTDSGKLAYQSTSEKPTDISFNRLSTPRGGIFTITLPDGTNAWLNAESSITYPTRFAGAKREVKITGEVYFEVAHDATHPFIVSVLPTASPAEALAKTGQPLVPLNAGSTSNSMQIEVLGTHFNINSYNDALVSPVRTTLLEGSVKISVRGTSRIIKPNEQAVASASNNDIVIKKEVDIDKVMAWKNGEMVMTNIDTKQLMREISRWYDVDVVFSGAVPNKQFYGSINRNVPLSSVLHVLQAYGIETKLESKKLIVQ